MKKLFVKKPKLMHTNEKETTVTKRTLEEVAQLVVWELGKRHRICNRENIRMVAKEYCSKAALGDVTREVRKICPILAKKN